MNIEDHVNRIKDSLKTIDSCIQDDLVARQRSIAFSASAVSADLLEIYFHKNNFIKAGTQVQHNWLKSKKKLLEKYTFDFPRKEEVFNLLFRLEKERDRLCYGKTHPEEVVIEFLEIFNKIKTIFRELGINEI